MDVLAIDGKNYVKSSVIARELGYTSDYVGQLCRSGKVEAKLFGRTWYVDKSSISGHKQTRYRSTAAITKKDLRNHIEVSSKDPQRSPVHVHISGENADREHAVRGYENFYTYSKKSGHAHYDTDSHDLIPKPRKILTIELAQAQKVSVEAKDAQYTFKTPTLPEIRFRGKLAVHDLLDEPVADLGSSSTHVQEDTASENERTPKQPIAPTGTHVHVKEVEHFKYKKAKNKVISSKHSDDTGNMHVRQVGPVSESVPVHLPEISRSLWRVFVYGCVSFCLGVVFSSVLMLFSSKVESVGGIQEHVFIFDTQMLSEVTSSIGEETATMVDALMRRSR